MNLRSFRAVKTIRRDILEILGGGWDLIGPRRDSITAYVAGLQNTDGGFRGRTTQSDLYYSVFAGEMLLSARTNFDRPGLIRYLRTINPQSLDFIHLCCWIRCAADMGILDGQWQASLVRYIEAFRCDDGLFHHAGREKESSIYGTFMAFSASQDLNEMISVSLQILSRLDQFRNADGSYRNESQNGPGLLPATAAAMAIQSQAGITIEQQTIEWMFSCLTDEGGFAVSPMIPVADLLSTATALQSLRQASVDLAETKNRCLSFVDGLFQDAGGFSANAFDATVDAEYTFYGLLALGNLNE
jgi:geranylgeranyl transferase type-2 subunit beta